MTAPAPQDTRDSIPRTTHLTYLQAALLGVAAGEPFEALRLGIREEARQMSRRVSTAVQPDDGFIHWATVRDTLLECMRLDLVERVPVPSKRTNVDAHRDRTYTLTNSGRAIVEAVGSDSGSFRPFIAPALIGHHPSFATLLARLTTGPIALRTYTEEELKAHRAETSLWVDRVAAEVAAHGEITMGLTATPEAITKLASGLRESLLRRFGNTAHAKPKDVLDTIEDAVCALTLQRVGVPLDAISFNTLMSWSRWLYVAEESRYVHGLPGRVIWATADVVVAEPPRVEWRGVGGYGDRVAKLLPQVYRELVDSLPGGAGSPLLPIYQVRATVAYHAGVANPVVDRVIAQIVEGERPVAFGLSLALGTTAWAATSEPPFTLGDRTYYVMSITPTSTE